MKQAILIILLLITSKTYCQLEFSIGFKDGYKIGYCYNQGASCVAPPAPPTPALNPNERSNNYFDGYNRGIVTGSLAKQNSNNQKEIQNNKTNNTYYQPQYIPKIERFKPDYNFYYNALSQLEKKYSETEVVKQTEKSKQISNEIKEFLSPENVNKRKEYIKFLKIYYNAFKTYPSTIPDGQYKAIYVFEPPIGKETPYPTFEENITVTVENNKIIYIKMDDNDYWSTEKFTDYKEMAVSSKIPLMYIIKESYPIYKGVGEYQGGVYSPSNNQTQPFEFSKIYFIDYIYDYQNAIECTKELKAKYSKMTKFNKVQDGWNFVQVSDGEGICNERKVFVENGKITKYMLGSGTETTVTEGGVINNCKSTISIMFKAFASAKEKKLILEIYFI